MKFWSAALLAAVAAVGLSTAAYVYGGKDELSLATTPAFAAETPASTTPMMSQPTATPLTDEQKASIGPFIREYLMQNPEIIRDAFEELQRKEEEAQVTAAKEAISSDKRIFNSSRQVVLGNPEGDTTLVEFFDYNCGYCKRAHADMKRLLEEDKNLRIVLKEFPILSQGSMEAAQVGVAVNMIAPERYFEFHDALISERGQVDGARAMAVAEDLGLDTAKIKEMSQSDEAKATIQEVHDLSQKLGINGTPTYVTPQEMVVGAVGYDTLKAKIDEARKACAATPC
jgi:protein-disulfide isomerase